MVRRARCVVDSVTHHGQRVYTISLSAGGPLPRFRPGQFLHLALDEYDPSRHWPDSRAFSIASSPADTRRLRILYSVKGAFTQRMERELVEGKPVWVKLPYGDFVIDDAGDVVLVAGGTGISAYAAFIEALPADGPGRVFLVYGARAPELLLHRATLAERTRQSSRLGAMFLAEDAPAAFLEAHPESRCQHGSGRIRVDAFWDSVPEPARATYYLSGPPAMLAALSSELRARGLPPERIRTDAWD